MRLATPLRCGAALLAAALLIAPRAAWAVVDFYSLFKTTRWNQTSNALPVSPASYDFIASLSVTVPANLTAATLTFGGSDLPLLPSPDGHFYRFNSSPYASQAAVDADFPNDLDYTFSILGGTLGAQSATLHLPPSSFYAAEVPFFTGTQYSDLQGMDPSQDFTFAWNGFTQVAGTNTTGAFLTIYDLTDGSIVFDQPFTNNPDILLLPGGTLLPGRSYSASLFYSSRIEFGGAGFTTGTSIMAYDHETRLQFTTLGPGTTAPEPMSGALALMGLSLGAVALRRRRAG